MNIRRYILVLLACSFVFSLYAEGDGLNLLPKPQQVVIRKGEVHLLKNGVLDADLVRERIVSDIPSIVKNREEGYKLTVSSDSIRLEALTQTGLYWGKQTLNQLVANAENGALPCCDIIDYPAFRIRGFMHDAGRSYLSVETLKEHIRLLSTYKINVFHWHLTENQAWRLQSNRFPQLNDSAYFERHPGKFYSIAEAREIADFCRAHHVLLIPEIDMPGHSAAFVRAMGVDMQSDEGMRILKNLLEEICTEVFPDVPYLHIGTDEVKFSNPHFVDEMVAFLRGLNKKVISWNPGWKYKAGEIDMTQLWSYRGKPQKGIPAIDSRFHYINHFDIFGDIVALYNSRIANVETGNEDIAGAILAVWNDRLLADEQQIVLQNNFFPAMLALAERAWLGGGTEYFDRYGTIIPTDRTMPEYTLFVDFEKRMLWHKSRFFQHVPFPYMKQTDMKWRITDAFPNEGDLNRIFPPEQALADRYQYQGAVFETRDAIGASVYLRHVWGSIVPAFYKDPQKNHTAYAYTWVWSPEKQTVGLWVSTQDYSRSEMDLAPRKGKWDYRESRIFLNDEEIVPPVWENTHTLRSNEVMLRNENFTARPPLRVTLHKGWNKVFFKLPIGTFSTPEVRLQKWMFTCMFVTPDGKQRINNLIFDPDRQMR